MWYRENVAVLMVMLQTSEFPHQGFPHQHIQIPGVLGLDWEDKERLCTSLLAPLEKINSSVMVQSSSERN